MPGLLGLQRQPSSQAERYALLAPQWLLLSHRHWLLLLHVPPARRWGRPPLSPSSRFEDSSSEPGPLLALVGLIASGTLGLPLALVALLGLHPTALQHDLAAFYTAGYFITVAPEVAFQQVAIRRSEPISLAMCDTATWQTGLLLPVEHTPSASSWRSTSRWGRPRLRPR